MDSADIAERLGAREPDADLAPEHDDFDQFIEYDEGDKTVICDRRNARAWVKSDTLVAIDP